MSKHLKRGLAVLLAAMLLISTLTNITGLYATGKDPVSRIYNAISGNTPQTAAEYAERAGEKIARDDYAGALEDFESARALTDDTSEICTLWLRTASVCVILGDDAQARSATDAALENDATSTQAQLLSAQLYLAEGDTANAVKAMEAYTALVPADVSTRETLAQAYETMGQYSTAAEKYRALADDIPTEVGYRVDILRCTFEAGEYEQVLTLAEGMEPENMTASVHQMLGISLLQLGRNDEAVDELTEAIELDGSRYYRGEALLALGRYADAETDFTAAIEAGFQTEYAYYNRGVCRVQLGAYESAMDDFDVALTSDDANLIEVATNALMQIADRGNAQ